MSIEAGQIVDEMQTQAAPPSAPELTNAEPVKTEAPAPRPDDRMSGKLEMLIKREQQALMKERQVKDLEMTLQEKLKLIQEFEEAKKGNSKKALELLGLNYDQLSQSILQDGAIPAEVGIKKLEDKIGELERQRELDRQREEDTKKNLQAQAETKAIQDFKTEIKTYLSDNTARYELISFEEQEELVFDVIDEHYKRTLDQDTGIGKVLSIKEAADKVEEFLEKKYDKAKQVSKVKTLWGAIPPKTQDALTKQVTFKVNQPKTLTNNMSANPSPKAPPRSEEERVKGILAEFLAKRGT